MKNGFRYDSVKNAWVIEKTPGSTLDYGHNWSAWLAETSGDSIASSSWAIDRAGLASASSQINGAITSTMLSGGTVGATYKVTNTITTANNRTTSRSFEVRIVATLSG